MSTNNKIKVFYNEKQYVENTESFSPSAKKPKLLLETIKENEKQLYSNLEIEENFNPLNVEDFYLVHNKQHVDEILSLKKENGFENKLKVVSDSLPWTNGSFVAAAEYSIETKNDSMSPTSGFHHAETERAMGFCTFNGLMIAAKRILIKNSNTKIGIIDFDAHYGNGTDEIINRQKLTSSVKHYTFGKFADTYKKIKYFDKWLENLPETLKNQCEMHSCDILLYQAGADPFVDDPYGGYLTVEQMALRDQIVFEFAKEYNIPIVWNLAGGYTNPISKVLEIHINTFKKYFETCR